jgi:hypothetical protein
MAPSQQTDFLIEPRPALLQRLDLRMNADMRRRMFEPVQMSQLGGTRKSRVPEADLLMQTKLLFLAAMHGSLEGTVSPDFTRVLGVDRLSPGLFDRWWVVRMFNNFLHLAAHHEAFKRNLERVVTDGNPIIEKWIERVKTATTAPDLYDGLDTETIVYLIDPRPALAPRLENRVSRDAKSRLMEPILVGSEELAESGWTPTDYALLVKQQFLAGLHDIPDMRSEGSFANVFGSDRIGGTLFDRWWHLTRLETYLDADQCVPMLASLRTAIETTGNPRVDAWIGGL